MTSFFCLSKQGKGRHEEEEETNPAQDKDVSKETAEWRENGGGQCCSFPCSPGVSMLSSVARGPTRGPWQEFKLQYGTLHT